MRAEWRKRVAFAEIAEALDIRTDQVMAAMPLAGRVNVLFTPIEGTTDIYAAQLRRDADGILTVLGKPHELPGMWESIQRLAEQELPSQIEQAIKDKEKP